MKEQVCAVVVTYNRKVLLVECLNALLVQTLSVERILVIDNASTDGTSDLLREKGYLDNSLIDYVRLPANVGGAGGFHEGFKRAFELGYDWLWVMDDDGLPHTEALKHLISPQDLLCRGPLILAKEDDTEQKLAFDWVFDTPLNSVSISTRKGAEDLADEQGIVRNYLNSPFNGVLFSRKVIECIGLPKKEFFLWGDEFDYSCRAKKAGIPMATVTKALFRHPTNRLKIKYFKILNRNSFILYADTPLRNYLYIRNHAYLASRYESLFAWAKHTIKYFLYYSIHSGQLNPLSVISYCLEGLTGNLHGHQRFLEAESR